MRFCYAGAIPVGVSARPPSTATGLMKNDKDRYWDCLDQAMEASHGGRTEEALAWLDAALKAHRTTWSAEIGSFSYDPETCAIEIIFRRSISFVFCSPLLGAFAQA